MVLRKRVIPISDLPQKLDEGFSFDQVRNMVSVVLEADPASSEDAEYASIVHRSYQVNDLDGLTAIIDSVSAWAENNGDVIVGTGQQAREYAASFLEF